MSRLQFLTLLTVVVNTSTIVAFASGVGLDCELPLAYILYPAACIIGLALIAILLVIAMTQQDFSAPMTTDRLALLCFGVIVLVFMTLVFSHFRHDLSFQLWASDYEHVIKLVESDDLRPSTSDIALLPKEFKHLSTCDGSISIDKRNGVTQVLFYTYKGWLGEIGGYVYRSDDLPPEMYGKNWNVTRPQRMHWFYVYND